MKPDPEKKPYKFYQYSQQKQDRIIADFWRDYFDKYPEPGTSNELNGMRVARGIMNPEKTTLTYDEFLKSKGISRRS